MSDTRNDLDSTVEALETAVARGGAGVGRAFEAFVDGLPKLTPRQMRDFGPRLAALIPAFPPLAASALAMIVGGSIEMGADPRPCAEPVLTGLRESLRGAAAFAAAWARTGDDAPPAPGRDDITEEIAQRVGDPRERATLAAVCGWFDLDRWQAAALPVLADPGVRAALPVDRAELLSLLAEVAALRGDEDFARLRGALTVLDDEPLVVLHRETRTRGPLHPADAR